MKGKKNDKVKKDADDKKKKEEEFKRHLNEIRNKIINNYTRKTIIQMLTPELET